MCTSISGAARRRSTSGALHLRRTVGVVFRHEPTPEDLAPDIRDIWRRHAASAGAHGDVDDAGGALVAAYAEPHRHYHDLTHLRAVLANVATLATYARDVHAVVLSACCHDVVYDPRAADNEERSAEWATTTLRGLGVDDGVTARVADLVRMTTDHAPPSGDTDGQVLCDADLAVLAAEPAAYAAYVAGVRREYAHVDDLRFARGRAVVLTSLLDKPHLYGTAYGRRVWEEAARRNIAEEVERLQRLSGASDAATPTPAAG